MSLTTVHESILLTDAEGIVNPVNCVGVMGKGLAKAMADRWERVEQPYKGACSNGQLRPGRVISIDLGPHWEPFFWDSNDRWGIAETPEHWLTIKRDLLTHGLTEREIVAAKSRPPSEGQLPGFGFYGEHRHSPTLGEFFTARDLVGPRWMICFPTKDHWRQPSRVEWIREGLGALLDAAVSLDLRSVAVPALGCGLGGLSWAVVRPMLEDWAASAPFEVRLYPPTE